jgi:hypothetical protein
VQHLVVGGEVAEMLFGGDQRLARHVAGLVGLDRLHEVIALVFAARRAPLRGEVDLGGGVVFAVGERSCRRFVDPFARDLLVGARDPQVQVGAELPRFEAVRDFSEIEKARHVPLVLRHRDELLAQALGLALAVRRADRQRLHELHLELEILEARALAYRRVGRVVQGLQRGAGLRDLSQLGLLLREREPQLRIVGLLPRHVAEVREAYRVGLALCRARKQPAARENEHERHADGERNAEQRPRRGEPLSRRLRMRG